MSRPRRYFWNLLLIGGTVLTFAPSAQAKLEDVEKAQELSRNNYVERFSEFTQDKNFLGRAQNPSGQSIQGKRKTRFNADDQFPFQSDLTYHDFSYEVEDETFKQANQNNNGPGPKTRTLYASVSGHGAISASGGSSRLEREAYQEHDKYKKEETKKEKEDADKKEGVQYRGVFKVETQEVFKDGQPKKGDDKTPDKVERWSWREESNPKIQQVGTESFQTLEKAAKEQVTEGENGMGTLEFYYKAANTALKSLWNSTLANLKQRQMYKGIEAETGSNPQISEEYANCDSWEQAEIAKLDPKLSQQERERRTKDIGKMKGQCGQMAKTDYRMINPKFKKDPNDPNAPGQLEAEGPEKEDARARDWRVALEVYGSVGKKAEDVQSNWKYQDKDNRNSVTTKFDENGQPAGTEQLTMDDSVNKYNDNLQQSAEAVSEIQKRFPGLQLKAEQITSYQIQKNTKRMDEITDLPAEATMEDFVPQAPNQEAEKLPETYEELVNSGSVGK